MARAQGEIEKGYTGGQMSKANEPNAHYQGNAEGTRSPKANNETYGSGERKSMNSTYFYIPGKQKTRFRVNLRKTKI